jgi:hypothetical protein
MARRVSARREKKPPRSKKFWWGVGCGSAAGLALLIVVIMLVRVTGGPALPREVRQRAAAAAGTSGAGAGAGGAGATTPAGSTRIPAGVPSLQGQLSQLQHAGTSGNTAPFTLYVRDSELNQMLASEQHSQLESAQAYFARGKAYVIMAVKHSGRTWNVTITAAPIVVQGGMQLAVESVKIGSMDAPAAVVTKVQEEINRNRSRFSAEKLGMYVESITVEPGVAILYGRPVPRR